MQIFVHSRGQRLGPLPLEEVNRRIQAGEFLPDDLAWHEGLPTWIPLRSVQGVVIPGGLSQPPSVAGASPGPMPPMIPHSMPVASPAKTDPLAICSLVFGIVGMMCCSVLLLSIAAVVCGHISLSNQKRNPGLEGKPLAITGLILGYVGIVVGVVYLIFIFGVSFASALSESMNK